jgi:hypothetical protein
MCTWGKVLSALSFRTEEQTHTGAVLALGYTPAFLPPESPPGSLGFLRGSGIVTGGTRQRKISPWLTQVGYPDPSRNTVQGLCLGNKVIFLIMLTSVSPTNNNKTFPYLG